MIEFLIAMLCCVALNFLLLYRVYTGPTVADRVCAADCMDLVSATGLVLYSLYCGRGIYLDISMVTALLGFLSTVCVAHYLEGRL